MKNGKRPTLRQKKKMKSHGLDPDKWLVVKDLQDAMVVVSRMSLKKIGSKPKLRRLEKETHHIKKMTICSKIESVEDFEKLGKFIEKIEHL